MPFVQDYSDVTEARLVRLQNERWKLLLKLYKFLVAKSHSVKFVLRHVAETLFVHETKSVIRRSTLIHAFEAYHVSHRLINAIYGVFDPFDKGTFDWRCMVFMLNVIVSPNKDLVSVLLDSSSFLMGRVTDVDAPCTRSGNTQLQLKDIEKIFNPIIRPDRMSLFVDEFNRVWLEEIAFKSSNVALQTISTNSMSLTFRDYQSVLKEMDTNRLLESDSLSWDQDGKSIASGALGHREMLEEYLYPNSLYKFRKLNRIMKHAIESLTSQAMKITLKRWKEMTARRRFITSTFTRIFGNVHIFVLSNTFFMLKFHAIKIIALGDIQRMWRGYYGRLTATQKRNEIDSIVRIQSFFRFLLARTKAMTIINRRRAAAIGIQRLFRGYFHGRRVAMNRKLTRQDEEQIQQAKDTALMNLFIAIRSARKLQRKFRANEVKKKYDADVAKRRRELEVERIFQLRKEEMEHEQEIYSRRVSIHMQNQKEALVDDKLRQDILAGQSDEVVRLRRRMKQETESKEAEERQKIAIEYRDFRREKLREEWAEEAENRCRSHRKLLVESLKNPETQLERQMRKKTIMLIKNRVPLVIRKADADEVKMELEEAREIAGEQVLDMLVKEKRAEIARKMENDLLRLDAKMEKEKQIKERRYQEKQLKRANWILWSAVKRWKARKELRLRCMEVYEKLFDEKYKAFFYRNGKTGEVSWNKPKALGSFDIPIPEGGNGKEWC